MIIMQTNGALILGDQAAPHEIVQAGYTMGAFEGGRYISTVVGWLDKPRLTHEMQPEKFVHLNVRDAIFAPGGEVDKHEISVVRGAMTELRCRLQTSNNWRQSIAPLAEHFHCGVDWMWWFVRYLARYANAAVYPELECLRDDQVYQLMNKICPTSKDRDEWEYIIEFVINQSRYDVRYVRYRQRANGEHGNFIFTERWPNQD